MRWRLLPLLLLLSAAAFAAPPQLALSEPSISPDGKTIAFVAGGDIWTVPAAGGDARLLVSDPAMESRPLWSPDGKSLAFISSRTGNGDIYLLDLGGGALRRLTWDDQRDQLDGWSPDGRFVYFSSTSRDISGMNDIWRVSVTGGTPMQVSAERYVNEYFAAPSPDGKTLALAARGISSGQWWRHGHSHIDESQIVLLRDGRYDAVTADGAKEIWPMWAPDGKSLFYMSDRDGNENIWTLPLGGQPRQVTTFKDGRLLWPSISRDGRTIVFERNFGIWKLDTSTAATSPVGIALLGLPSGPAVEHRRLTDRFNDLALSPDGKKIAFTARGDVYAASVKEAGDAARITNTSALESHPVWSLDSRKLVYVSDRDGTSQLFQYDFASEQEKQLTTGSGDDDYPGWSPDGKSIAFLRNARQVVVLDSATLQTRNVAPILERPRPLGPDRPFVWSPDSRWLAYTTTGEGMFRNVFVVPAAGGDARPVSFLANAFVDSLAWSPDGRFLLMNTGQRTEENRIARVDLVPLTPKFREEQFRDLFREPSTKTEDQAPATPTPVAEKPAQKKKPADVTVDFANIRERVRLLPIGVNSDQVTISPDGKWIAFVGSVGEADNVFVYSIDELANEPAVPKQLSASSGRKSDLQFSPDSKEVFYLDAGRIAAASIDPVKARVIPAVAEMDVDFQREKEEAFRQAWTYERDSFFDPKMNGADWPAIRAAFEPRVAAARTPDEFRRLLSLMVGELNASHLGASAPADQLRSTTGRIGVRFDPAAYDSGHHLKVAEVLPLSPADVAKVRVGDVIAAVDGQEVAADTNFDQLLEYKAGKRVSLTLAGSDGSRRTVTLQPVKASDEKALTYRAWVNANRDYVNRVSGGRLGYVHMPDMSFESLQRLFVDLDADNRSKDGVVVDVRNNNGGFVNVYAIDVLARQPYLTMTPRDFPAAGARSVLGQRALEKPTVLLTNRHSLSDAEDFTEGYRTLRLGKVVGEPTAGWILFTSNTTLIDGTQFRLPFTRITDNRGETMEMHPRPVDVFVQRSIGEGLAGKDSQLDAAVKELLSTLPKK